MKPLSFIIITYNRPADMLELLQNIRGLDKADDLLEEVVVLNNCSTEDYAAVRNYIGESGQFPFRYYDAPENLGVAKGRNFALGKSSAPVIIMLDDDAVLQNKDALVNLVSAFGQKDNGRERAIISFKVIYYDTLEMQQNALPHKDYEKYRNLHSFPTYFYAGGAHAVRRNVMDEVGAYPPDFFYGMEEYDLAYRILDAGYSIEYNDSIVMLHKESPLGRKPKREKLQMMWVNKTKVAYRYLPIRYFYSTAFMWSLFYLKNTGFDLVGFLKGWAQVNRIRRTEQRRQIGESALAYLEKVGARLWY